MKRFLNVVAMMVLFVVLFLMALPVLAAPFEDLDLNVWRVKGVRVTSTADELNRLDGVTTTAAELNALDASLYSTGTASNWVSETTVPVKTMKRTLVVTALPVVIAEGGSGTNGYGGKAFFTFPAGVFSVRESVLSDVVCVSTGTLSGGSGGDVSIGTAVATDGALSGTMADMTPSCGIDPITNMVAGAHLVDVDAFDGHSTPVKAYFNVNIDDGDISATQTTTWSFVWEYVIDEPIDY